MGQKRYSNGFTMIEILISVLILAIGLLGLAGLQTSGLRSVNNASLYTESTLAMNDLIERLRANPKEVNLNTFSAITSAANIDCTTLPNPYCSQYYNGSSQVAAQSCTSSQMATYDLNVWFCGERIGNTAADRAPGVVDRFPQASLTIQCIDTNPASGADADPCTDGSPHRLTLTWQEPSANRDGSTGLQNRSVSMTFMPALR